MGRAPPTKAHIRFVATEIVDVRPDPLQSYNLIMEAQIKIFALFRLITPEVPHDN